MADPIQVGQGLSLAQILAQGNPQNAPEAPNVPGIATQGNDPVGSQGRVAGLLNAMLESRQMDMGQPTLAQPTPVAHPGMLKSAITNYFQNVVARISGEPTNYERQRQGIADANVQATTAHTNAITQQMGQMITLPNGATMPYALAIKAYPQLLKNEGALDTQGLKNEGTANVANINQGVQLPVTNELSTRFGLPPGSTIGDKTLSRLLGIEGKNIIKNTVMLNGSPHQVFQNKATSEIVHDNGIDPTVAINDAKANSFANAKASLTPFTTFDNSGKLVTISAGKAIATGVPPANVWNQLYGATGQTKSGGQAAEAVAGHIPAYQESVRRLAAKGELGPVLGRMNTYLTQGYGGNDPDIAEFITTTGLIKSGALRAHFGAKGGVQLLDRFDKALNTAQTPEAIIGSTNAIDSFMKGYGAAASNSNTPHTDVTAPGGTAPVRDNFFIPRKQP